MQNLEWLLLLISIIYIGFNRPINLQLKKNYVIGLLVGVLLIHFLFNGYRWQMIPAYFLWVIALITAIKQSDRKPSMALKVLKIIGLTIVIILAVALPSLLPVFDLPEPRGEFTVGTKDILLELDRDELITADKNDKRSFMIKVWYPSKSMDGEKDLYVDQAGRNGFAVKYGLTPSMLNYLDKVDTHVFRDIEIADGTFPVLIFSHGYNSKANSYYALLSELASRGYVIFALNHTYESTGATFPNGDLKYFDYEFASQIESNTWHIMEPVVEAFKSDLSYEERHPIIKTGLTTYFVRGMVERWAEDIVDVVDELNQWNQEGFFQGKLDTSKVGVFGHSRGGGAAGESLLIDDRIKAGANVDGVQWGRIVDTAFDKPFLFISADWPEEKDDLNSHAYINKSTAVFYDTRILETGHSSFMDIPFMIPLEALSQAGSIDPTLGMEITSNMVASFFDKHLKSEPIDMKNLDKKYDMLRMNIYSGDSIP
ncbi:hypothetical protein [Lutimonas sp.]|uniref:alpha/beta hydrolase n=1 Tax=Lutimonas sp. TaxID=1872403 RepID=UPI003D9AE219